MAIALIVAVHFLLRSAFVPDAPQAGLSMKRLVQGLWPSLQSAWLPGGLESLGQIDYAIKLLWIGFTVVALLGFLCIASKPRFAQFFGLTVLGVVLCTPALGTPRAFGIALPSLVFFTAIAVAVIEIN